MAYPDDGSNRLFVGEQHQAKIWSFVNQRENSDRQLFLQLPDPINRGNEEGLLGLAFHPKFKENKQFFVYYSANDRRASERSVVSRFRVSRSDAHAPTPRASSGSGSRPEGPLREPQRRRPSPSGRMAILTSRWATAAPADDPLSTGQNPGDWFGSILRIDVDHPARRKPYGIPKENPQPRDPSKYTHWVPEVYCIGLRNVWKFSFDRKTGDCGPAMWDRTSGRWSTGSRTAGTTAGASGRDSTPSSPSGDSARTRPPRSGRRSSSIRTPTSDRPDSGLSITGGYVYRGKKIPELVGVYVYGDFDTGRIWGLRYEDGKVAANGELIEVTPRPKLNIASFGEDAQGELYILAFDGQIHELVPRSHGATLTRRPLTQSGPAIASSPERNSRHRSSGSSMPTDTRTMPAVMP